MVLFTFLFELTLQVYEFGCFILITAVAVFAGAFSSENDVILEVSGVCFFLGGARGKIRFSN